MNPIAVASIAKGATSILSNKKVQIAILIIIAYMILKKKIGKVIWKYRQNKFDKNEGDIVNQLAQQYRAAANPSGIAWMIDLDGTNEGEIEKLGYQTKGKLQQIANAYRLKFEESLTDRMRKELSAKDFQNWRNIVT